MGKKPEIKFERVQMSDPNPPIKSGTKIRITDKKLPGYNQEFYISHKPFVDSDLYSYMKDPDQIICDGYAGVSQFEICQ